MPDMTYVWMITTIGLVGILLFIFMLVRGVPIRMGLSRMRRRTFIIVDNDTYYSAPGVKKDVPEGVETSDKRWWGKAFRIKMLEGIRIGLAVPNDFILADPTMALATEIDNEEKEDPNDYIKMEDSRRGIKYNGRFVRMSEITKGLTAQRSPVLIKAAMSRAAQEERQKVQGEPAKYGTLIMMVCLGLGFLAILLAKSGLF